MAPVVDLVTGPSAPKYTAAIFERLHPRVDTRLLASRGYGASQRAMAYRLLHHPLSVARARRRRAILHVDSQLLAYLLAAPLRGPRVITCLDVIPFLPEFDDPSYVSRNRMMDRMYYRLLARGLRRADRVVAISEHVKADLRRLGLTKAPVDVVPMGVDLERYRPQGDAEHRRVREAHGIPDGIPIVLSVGTEHPRKNLPGLLRSFQGVSDRAVLVKVGRPRTPQRGELLALASSLGIRDRVRFLDVVPEPDLPALYSAATVLAFPSLYEGFGLPPLEAMACGTPVVVARTSSVPEVVGDAGLYVEPKDDAAFAEALGRVLDDPELRTALAGKGRERAAGFGWERTIRGLRGTYEKAAAR